jgi:hypothetical protein
MLKRLGCYFHEGKQRYVAPSEPTIRRVLQSQDSETAPQILNGWVRRHRTEQTNEAEAIAVDGKVLKGARDDENHQTKRLKCCIA